MCARPISATSLTKPCISTSAKRNITIFPPTTGTSPTTAICPAPILFSALVTSPGRTGAGHSKRLADFRLDLFPNHVFILSEYDHTSDTGNGIANFVANADEYPVQNLTRDSSENCSIHLGALAVHAQYDRFGGYGQFRGGCAGGVLPAGGASSKLRANILKVGVAAGTIATLVLLILPAGDRQGRMVTEYQPATLAAIEGLFQTVQGAPIALVGQPDMNKLQLDNPITVPNALSFLTFRRWTAEVKGLNECPRDYWPDNIPLLYFAYHIMVGLGTILLALMVLSAFLLLRAARCIRADRCSGYCF